jgi:diguanylate cyclase (GGDEF)-like protein/PAS domain S-box-containing protein
MLYVAWERAGWGSENVRNVLGNLAFVPLNGLVATLFFLAARNPNLDRGVRRALNLFASGCVLVLIGNGISTYYLVALDRNPPVTWADPFYLTDSVLNFAALLSFPIARRSRMERLKFGLDAAIVLIGGMVAIWYFTVLPSEGSRPGGLQSYVLVFAYPLASLMVFYGATTVLLRGTLDGNRRALRWLLAGVLVSIVADQTYDLVTIESGSRAAAWTDGVYCIAYLMLVLSGEHWLFRPVTASPAAARTDFWIRTQPLTPLPTAAVAATYGLLLAATVTPWHDPISQIAIGAVLMTALVVIRQVIAVRQNVRLLTEAAAEARFRSLVQNSSDLIIVVRASGAVRFASPSVARVLGRQPGELQGRQFRELVDLEDRDAAAQFLAAAAQLTEVSAPSELRFRLPDGRIVQTELLATNLLEDPTVRGVVLNGRDVSERRQLEQQLKYQAFHDPLTGLANRALFLDRVSHALALGKRHRQPVCVLYLDLDDFKKVNDSMGHAEGDRLLVATAERLHAGSRIGDTIARLGGDEFAMLIEGVLGDEGLRAAVERIQAALSRPFLLGGSEVPMSVSIGVATSAPTDSGEELLRNADMAMYSAKRRGKGRAEVFRAQMYAEVKRRIDLEAALRHALGHDELDLVYQPIYSLRSGGLEGLEALVRWDHRRFGAMLPQHFIPLAEETGLIVQLGNWVLRHACRQLTEWRELRPGLPLRIAVNISGRQLHEEDIVAETRDIIAESGVDPTLVTLEITESVLMQRQGSVLERLRDLKHLGIQLAIDDFGTGYSSLSYLQRFPIDQIKIAKPFVEELGGGLECAALARAIIGLGETLKLSTVAEGVERTDQVAALINLGCDLGQGYFFSPPLPPDEVVRRLDHPRLFCPLPRVSATVTL